MLVAEARDPYVPWLKVSISEAWIQAMILTRKLSEQTQLRPPFRRECSSLPRSHVTTKAARDVLPVFPAPALCH